jgi:transposase-like protein
MESIIKDSPTKTRRKFDKSFKCEVVRNWLSSGKSAAGGRRPAVEDLQSQLDAARREIRHLHEQRDILKKTLGILSEPSGNATNGLTR